MAIRWVRSVIDTTPPMSARRSFRQSQEPTDPTPISLGAFTDGGAGKDSRPRRLLWRALAIKMA